MSDLESALAANRAAADELLAAGERVGPAWLTPRAPGKWSPSQIVEHVARALEESAHVVSGAPSNFPTLPGFIRPIVRGLVFNRVLKTGKFPRARAPKAFDPLKGPATTAEGRGRLNAAVGRFEQECRARLATKPHMVSTVFGKVLVQDYVRFQELHTRHHSRQITTTGD